MYWMSTILLTRTLHDFSNTFFCIEIGIPFPFLYFWLYPHRL